MKPIPSRLTSARHTLGEWLAWGLGALDKLWPEPPPGWHLDCCQVREAWQSLGATPDRPEIDWQGLRIGHIDTGYTGHPAFGFPPNNWIDADRAVSIDRSGRTAGATDAMRGIAAGHGTASGSLVCGADTGPYRYYGSAPRLPLVPVRISDCYLLDRLAREFRDAVSYLVDEVRVDIINVSMGTALKSDAPRPIRDAVDDCYERGVLMIAAAGNVPLRGWPAFPAALPRAIAVAGITPGLKPWWLSSSGDWVDFSAPARRVRRALVQKDAKAPQGLAYGYTASLGGTTFATAMASGIAALWLLKHRADIEARYQHSWRRVEAFRSMARNTTIVPPGWDGAAGFGPGVLNAAALMDRQRLPEARSLDKR